MKLGIYDRNANFIKNKIYKKVYNEGSQKKLVIYDRNTNFTNNKIYRKICKEESQKK
jgi:hypothetical protein